MNFFQAIQIQEEADRLLQQHRDLMEDVDMQKRDAEDMLNNGIRQQQVCVLYLHALLMLLLISLTTAFSFSFLLKVCLHVTSPPLCLLKSLSKFNIVSMMTDTDW